MNPGIERLEEVTIKVGRSSAGSLVLEVTRADGLGVGLEARTAEEFSKRLWKVFNAVCSLPAPESEDDGMPFYRS